MNERAAHSFLLRNRKRWLADLRMLVAILAAGAITQACGGGPEIPAVDLSMRVEGPPKEVELGRGFPLTVTRVWSKDLVPAAWDDRALAPLALRLTESSRREDGARVEETRRFQAYAFTLTNLAIPAPAFVAKPRDGGAERKVVAGPIRLHVMRALDPERPGPPELPSLPPPEPFAWALWGMVGGILLVLAIVGGIVRRRLRGRASAPIAAPVAAVPPPGPHVEALDRLRRLREREPAGIEQTRADFMETSAVVRTYVAARFAVRSAERTTEELLAAPPVRAAGDAPRGRLGNVLISCDLVKFAGDAPASGDRTRLLDAAEAFVRETAIIDSTEPSAAARPAAIGAP
jgi:hypothetical protein